MEVNGVVSLGYWSPGASSKTQQAQTQALPFYCSTHISLNLIFTNSANLIQMKSPKINQAH